MAIYNIPGSEGEMMYQCCENASPDIEQLFVNNIVDLVVEALNVSFNEKRIVAPLLKKAISNKINRRYKSEGLLQQYEAYILEKGTETLREQNEVPDDIKVNHSNALHAKLNDITEFLAAEDQDEWLKKFRAEKK